MALPILIAVVVFSVVILWLFFYYVPIGLWITAIFSGVPIGIGALIGMRFRKVPPTVIVGAMINATKAGLTIDRNALEAHYLAGGNVQNVVNALISADKANIPLDFNMATAIDLAGRDVLLAVQMSVNPKVIDTPPVTAVAKDGIQLIAKARVTVRANIKQLVGGAGAHTYMFNGILAFLWTPRALTLLRQSYSQPLTNLAKLNCPLVFYSRSIYPTKFYLFFKMLVLSSNITQQLPLAENHCFY